MTQPPDPTLPSRAHHKDYVSRTTSSNHDDNGYNDDDDYNDYDYYYHNIAAAGAVDRELIYIGRARGSCSTDVILVMRA